MRLSLSQLFDAARARNRKVLVAYATAGDPSQQKMMMVMMPVMMLVMFYQFPAALGLYWTVSQVFAIAGVIRAKHVKRKNGGVSGGTLAVEPPRETRQMRRDRMRNA